GGTEAAPKEEWFGIVGSAPAPRRESRVRAAPFVRKLARERGINLADVQGSGPQGRVRIADLDQSTPPERPAAQSDAVPPPGLRKAIADHMVEAWRNAPQVTSMDLLDATELVHAREALLASAGGV